MTWYKVNLYLGNQEDRLKRLRVQKEHRHSKNPLLRTKRRLYVGNSRARTKGYAPCTTSPQEIAAAYTGRCSVCTITEARAPKGLVIDHCHITGKFRGWLCHKCNSFIGMAGDDVETVRRALAYLERHPI